MTDLRITDHKGNPIGRIWSDGDAVIKSDPPALIALTRRFLEPGGLSADQVLESMVGYSNGYLCVRRAD